MSMVPVTIPGNLCVKSKVQPIVSNLFPSHPILMKKWQINFGWEFNKNTKLIFLSHITSPTALRLPVEMICAKAQKAGILSFIDGAHVPGQIPLNLKTLQADFYTGNCHKWMLSPKGAGFLYAHPRSQHLIEPLIVSWGIQIDPVLSSGSKFVDMLTWTGTHDPAAFLSVPAAI